MEILVVIALLFLIFIIAQAAADSRMNQFVAAYRFPDRVTNKVLSVYPHLSPNDSALVIKALKEYFNLCRTAKSRTISMPSQVVDVAWHEFILFTRAYQEFCDQGIGRFLHHIPAEAMQSRTKAQNGIKRAWRLACQRENIDPKNPRRLPLLFAIDADLNIPDGFKYLRNCESSDAGYCASHVGCGGGCSGGGCSGGGGDGGGCGGGCGGCG